MSERFYSVKATERLVCEKVVAAKSLAEAKHKMEDILANGSENWVSRGVTFSAREIHGDFAVESRFDEGA